jgi:hypothetical protein
VPLPNVDDNFSGGLNPRWSVTCPGGGQVEIVDTRLRLEVSAETISADGAIIGVAEGQAFRVSYQVTCDVMWRARAVRVIGTLLKDVVG